MNIQKNTTRTPSSASVARSARAVRTELTKRMSSAFKGQPDTLIRASYFDLDSNNHGKDTLFDFDDTIVIAALLRVGVNPRVAAAIVNEGYAFPAADGEHVQLPPDANFEPVDFVKLRDGSLRVIFMDDVPLLDFSKYDCWALRNGKPVEIAAFDPTKWTLESNVHQYRAKANLGEVESAARGAAQ